MVELEDGTLYFNTRDQHGEATGTRGVALSKDGGESFQSGSPEWKGFRPVAGVLDPPVVQCALLGADKGLIVFSGPDENGPTGKGRSDLGRPEMTQGELERPGTTWDDQEGR